MSLFIKIGRNVRRYQYLSKIPCLNPIPCLQKYSRDFHSYTILCARTVHEYENRYAYSILENKGYAISLKKNGTPAMLTTEEFQKLLQTNWSKKSQSEIFEAFERFALYCSENGLCISNKMFDTFVDFLTDNIKLASDEELKSLFYTLSKWPETESVRTRNYIEVWVALDDECMKRYLKWSNDQLLTYVSMFYMIGVVKFSDFCIKSLNKLASRVKQLTPEQLVQALFFIGVWRKQPFDMHNLEIYLNDNFTKFSIDDLAVIAMGFFKSKTPIRNPDLILKILNLVVENSKTIHEVSLAALLKLIRFSSKIKVDDRIYRLLDTLQHEVPRLSIMCNIHLALVGTSTLTFHEQCLSAIANATINSLPTARLKDLERLVLTYGTFNFKPKTAECFFTKVINELRSPNRLDEIMNYGRSFSSCVTYLSLLEIYPVDLINKALSRDFLERTYGKTAYNYGKEILTLHNVAEIFCKNDVSNRLTEKVVKVLAKRYTDYVPSEDYPKEFNITEKMVLEVMSILRECRGGTEYVVGEHILSHHQRGDIIVCNKNDGSPVPVEKAFPSYDFGLLRRPPDDNIWTVLVIAGRNAIIKDTHTATGHFSIKLKELQALGYNAALVPWSLYSKFETIHEKAEYLNKLISEAKTNKESIVK